VSLIKTVRLPANFTAVVPVQAPNVNGSVMLEPLDSLDSSLQIAESLIEVRENGSSAMVITNTGKSTYQLQKGMELGQAVVYELVDKKEGLPVRVEFFTKDEDLPIICGGPVVEETIQLLPVNINLFSVSLSSEKTTERLNWRQQRMSKMLNESNKQLLKEHLPLEQLLVECHGIFSPEEEERGETNLIKF